MPQVDDGQRWLDLAQAQVVAANADLLNSELLSTLIEFCKTSRAWNDTIGPFNIRAGKARVDLLPDTQSVSIGHIYTVFFNGRPIHRGDKQSPYHTPEIASKGASIPRSCFQSEPGVLQLVPTPNTDVSQAIEVVVSFIPVELSIPSFFLTHHFDAIMSGLLGRMYAHPDKPYSNTKMALFHQSRFSSATAAARREADATYMRGATHWTFPGGVRKPFR